MKKAIMTALAIALLGLVVTPAIAGSLNERPALKQTIDQFYAKRGEAAPQATYGYLFDLVTNAYSTGWGSVVVMTNYNSMVKNHIQGWIVPKDANPGEEIPIDKWLNPYEVFYLNLGQAGLGDENGWLLIWSTIQDFGSGVLIYNTSTMAGMVWEHGWYFAY